MNTQHVFRPTRPGGSGALRRLPLLLILVVVAALLLPARLVQAEPTWHTAPSLPAGRFELAATTGTDGTLYAIGGDDGFPQSAVYSYKPGTDTSWQTAPSLPQPLHAPGATTGTDGTLYVIGGNHNGPQSTVYSFKPGTDTSWQAAPSLPVALYALAATTGADGTLYAIGGRAPGGYQSTVYSFKPGTDTQWQAAPSLPAALDYLAATTGADGTLYAIGGEDSNHTSYNTVYSYKPGTDTSWQTAPALPAALSYLAATTGADGTLYAIGGTPGFSSTVYSFNPGTDTSWQTAPSLPIGLFALAATTGADGTIYAIGGEVFGGYQSAVYSFTPSSDTTAPTTTIRLSPAQPSGQHGWYTGPVTVGVSATDPDDAASTLTIRCALDAKPNSFADLPGGPCPYAVSGGASMSADGVHTLDAASEDPFNQVETPVQHTSFRIDQTGPSITDQQDHCGQPGNNGWCRGTETATFAYSDALSGMASPCSAAPGASCIKGVSSTGDGAAVVLSSGSATDGAGNTTAGITSGPLQIDSTPPTVTCQSSAPSFVVGQSGAMVSATVSDATSGPAQTSVSAPAPTSSAGSFSVSLTGYDKAGNRTTQSCPYAVTKAAQTITFAALPDRVPGDAAITVSATGGGSGNPVTFTASPASVCTSGGTNGAAITLVGVGTCTVTASQQGNQNYQDAIPVGQSFQVASLQLALSVSPSVATTGQKVTVSFTLGNHTSTAKTVSGTVTFAYTGGSGTKSIAFPFRLTLAPGQTLSKSITYTIPSWWPRGTYTTTIKATDGDGTASSSASLTVT
jgi:N-acetylneuraminic acid mutarotase